MYAQATCHEVHTKIRNTVPYLNFSTKYKDSTLNLNHFTPQKNAHNTGGEYAWHRNK